jgi:hypothetical protein
MAEIVGGLFGVTPESLTAQREAALAQQATNFAQLSPMQSAQAGFYTAGNRLAGAAGGLLGAQDPEMMRIQQRQQLLQGIDIGDPKALRERASAAMQNNDYAAAQQLASRAMDIEAKMASTAKDVAAANRERVQAVPNDIQKAQRIAALRSAIPQYEAAGDTGTASQLQAELDVLSAAPKGAQSELGKLLAERSTLNPETDKTQIAAYDAKIKKLTTGGGIGSEIAAGLSPIMGAIAKGQATKSAEAGGTAVGKDVAAIQGKYTALNSVDDALNVVKKGIYAGGYGPLEEGLAKYSKGVLADKQRLVNTEEFRAYIGDVVIPRLTEFGGNDSVEELKYLKSVMAGETTMESKSIERILTKAKTKIEAGIKRTQKQQEAIGTGQQLPTGPVTGRAQQRTTRSGVVYTVEGE